MPAGAYPFVRPDYLTEIAYNRRQSLMLLILFPLMLAGLGWVMGRYLGDERAGIGLALAVGVIYAAIVYYAGGGMVLAMTGARPADPQRDRTLLNVVEEMAIAAGLPMPRVAVIETAALNAFATGRDPAHATVAVTRGLLEKLNREELQGVVGHEMSHVRNYDIRFMLLVAGLVGAVALLADALRRMTWWGTGGRRGGGMRRGGGVQVIILAVGLVFALLAPLFAYLVQMAISRQREFLADASSVELTRNPLGLAAALEKLEQSRTPAPWEGAGRAIQHLFIVNPLRHFGMKSGALFSTHPPTEARIRLLRAMAGVQ